MAEKIDTIFTTQSSWWGGFYELAMELCPSQNNNHILRALSLLWCHDKIIGPYESNEIKITEQDLVDDLESDERHYYGVVKLTDTLLLGCGSYVVKEEDGSAWLLFYVPGAMASLYLGQSSEPDDIFSQDNEPLLNFFLRLGVEIYSNCGFRIGLLGHEVSGELYAETITKADIPHPYAGIILPYNHRLASESTGMKLTDDLCWTPPK